MSGAQIDVQIFKDIAVAALALLIAVLAIYLAVKLLGKFAKFMIGLIAILFVLWFLFSDHSILQTIMEMVGKAKDSVGDIGGAVGGVVEDAASKIGGGK